MNCRFGTAMVLGLCASGMALHGQLSFSPGTVNLQPNLAGQVVQLVVNNAGAALPNIGGINFFILIGNGGPDAEDFTGVPAGTGILGPTISGVDFETGTPFAGNAIVTPNPDNRSQLQAYGVESNTTPVTLPNGNFVLATLTLSTVGLFVDPNPANNQWALAIDFALPLVGGLPLETRYLTTLAAEVPMSVSPGTLVLVPEVGGTMWAVGGLLAGFAAYRRLRPAA